MLKLKVGDKVKVIAGKDKGRDGVIEKVYGKENKAIVSGINVYRRHIKKSLARDKKGGVYELFRPIDMSKIAIIDPKKNKPTRVSFKIEGGKKLRISRLTGVILDKVESKKK